jgi:signal transduction histidine kinase
MNEDGEGKGDVVLGDAAVAAPDAVIELTGKIIRTTHESVRVPVVTLDLAAEALLDAFGPLVEAQADAVRRARANALTLLEMVNSTLDLSRIESGRVPVSIAEIALADLLNELQVETRDWHDKPGVEFDWRLAPSLPLLRTDAENSRWSSRT